jgi:hypothetical protein
VVPLLLLLLRWAEEEEEEGGEGVATPERGHDRGEASEPEDAGSNGCVHSMTLVRKTVFSLIISFLLIGKDRGNAGTFGLESHWLPVN